MFGEIEKKEIERSPWLFLSLRNYWGIPLPRKKTPLQILDTFNRFEKAEREGEIVRNHDSIHLILNVADLFALWKNHNLNITTFHKMKALPRDTGTIY